MAAYFVQECPTCGRNLQVRVDYMGKRVVCQHCSAKFQACDPSSAAFPRTLAYAAKNVSCRRPAGCRTAPPDRSPWSQGQSVCAARGAPLLTPAARAAPTRCGSPTGTPSPTWAFHRLKRFAMSRHRYCHPRGRELRCRAKYVSMISLGED